MSKEKLDHLEAVIEETIKNNSYGFTKIKNIVCERADLDQLLFIISGLRKGKKLKDFVQSPKHTDAVKELLEAYDIKE